MNILNSHTIAHMLGWDMGRFCVNVKVRFTVYDIIYLIVLQLGLPVTGKLFYMKTIPTSPLNENYSVQNAVLFLYWKMYICFLI